MTANVLMELESCFGRVVLRIVIRALVREVGVEVSAVVDGRHDGENITLMVRMHPQHCTATRHERPLVQVACINT